MESGIFYEIIVDLNVDHSKKQHLASINNYHFYVTLNLTIKNLQPSFRHVLSRNPVAL